MALTQLSDIIDVTVFQDLPAVDSPEKTAFFDSGIIVRNSLLDTLATSAGKTAELPFWKDLDATSAPNLSSDDAGVTATPDKIVQGDQIARKLFLNNGWSESDLAAEVAMGGDAMTRVRARLDTYWRRQWQRRLVAATVGIQADNVANDSGDMVYDASTEDGNNATASNLFSRTNFTSAAFTLGDHFEMAGVVAMHSVVYKRAVDNNDVDFIPDSEGNMTIPTYLGKRVIIDDGMTVVAGSTSGFKYTTILFGEGAFGWGEGTPRVPLEVERGEGKGNGAGIETLWSRKTWLLHPFGYQYTGTPAADSPSLAEYRLAGSWDRVVDRKNAPICYLVTNG